MAQKDKITTYMACIEKGTYMPQKESILLYLVAMAHNERIPE